MWRNIQKRPQKSKAEPGTTHVYLHMSIFPRHQYNDRVMDNISISSAPNIASHYAKCTEAFSWLCDSLRSSDSQYSDHVDEGEAQDEFGRLRLWAGTMCAYRSGESSLDNRLKDAVHVRQQVVSLLEDLYSNLREGRQNAYNVKPRVAS